MLRIHTFYFLSSKFSHHLKIYKTDEIIHFWKISPISEKPNDKDIKS